MKSLLRLSTILFLLITSSVIAQNQWDIQLSQSYLDCSAQQVCYQLELQNATASAWTLGDQNYRLFFDGDLMTITSVNSLLPNTYYGGANIDQNIKISGLGQEAASPLDDIDDNLGFLDFSIVQTDKSNPGAATQLVWGTFTPIAEICVSVTPEAINSTTDTNCLAFYHSRPSTAGNITNQYTTISENNAPGSTTATMGNNYNDLTAATTVNQACLGASCAPTNLPPMLQNLIRLVDEDGTLLIDVAATATDDDGNIDLSTTTIIDEPSNGTTSINPTTGVISYEPNPDFNGMDTLLYRICDDGIPALCDTARVVIVINSVNDAPIANDDQASTNENQPVAIPVLDNDTDVDGPINPANIQLLEMPSNGIATINTNTGEIIYVPNPNFSGMDTLVYIVCDNLNSPIFCGTATVIITINDENKAPTPGNESIYTAPDIAVNDIDLIANNIDPQGDDLTVLPPANSLQGGVVTNNNNGTIDYTPPSGFSGQDMVIYTVCDPMPLCVTDTLFIQVGGCLTIQTWVWLEGAYQQGSMHTQLNDRGYLPGQTPTTFMGQTTPAGQPYNQAPWWYSGTEGIGSADANYAPTVVDWVLVSLRSGTNPATTACRRAGLLHSDGHISFLADFDCCNINLATPYYIVVEHRNHLLVMSPQPVAINGTTINFDFRTQQSYTAGGTGQTEVATGIFAMLSANSDQTTTATADTQIDAADQIDWQNVQGNHSGYYAQDFDLNGDINVQDKNLYLKNKQNTSNVPNGN